MQISVYQFHAYYFACSGWVCYECDGGLEGFGIYSKQRFAAATAVACIYRRGLQGGGARVAGRSAERHPFFDRDCYLRLVELRIFSIDVSGKFCER